MESEGIVEQLYRGRHHALVRALSRNNNGRANSADLSHSIFVRLLERLSSAAVDNPPAYLQRMARNEAIDLARREGVERQALHALAIAQPVVSDGVDELENRDLLRRVEEILLRLKPKTRQIFLAHRVEGLSYSEIAVRYGMSVKGVEKQMSKALAHLDRCLGDRKA